VLRALDAGAPGPGPGPDRSAAAERLTARLFRPLRLWPTTCLWRALGGYAALRAAGADVRFLIGVRGGPDGEPEAHAWLTRGGLPSVGAPGPEAGYTVAFAWPAGPDAIKMRPEAGSERMPITQSEDAILTELKDGTGVLLHLGTKHYFTLNATGVTTWKLLEGGARDAAELGDRLAASYPEADAAAVRADVAALLEELVAEGLAVRRG